MRVRDASSSALSLAHEHLHHRRSQCGFFAVFVVGSITMFALHELHMTIWPEETMLPATASKKSFRPDGDTRLPTMLPQRLCIGSAPW